MTNRDKGKWRRTIYATNVYESSIFTFISLKKTTVGVSSLYLSDSSNLSKVCVITSLFYLYFLIQVISFDKSFESLERRFRFPCPCHNYEFSTKQRWALFLLLMCNNDFQLFKQDISKYFLYSNYSQ